jgi:hypothetical protein
MKLKIKLISVLAALFISSAAFSQCDTIADICVKHISSDFISDGQQYRALLRTDEMAEFEVTLYGGSKYRISACSGFTDGNLIFTILDQQRNVLFSNNEYEMSAYWDFEVASTINAIIEAKLKPSEAESGCAVLLIGFQQ